jgi:hypothetical protein
LRPEIVFLLEERSAKAMLEALLPRISSGLVQFQFFPFEGKTDLERSLVRRIQAYQNSTAKFVILRDQDSESDCRQLKQRLMRLCNQTGRRQHCVVRIACRELESFYLADLKAGAHAFQIKGLERKQGVSKLRSPDQLGNPKQELKQLTRNGYQPIAGSRAIGEHLDVTNSRSPSFRALIEGIRRLEAELLGA